MKSTVGLNRSRSQHYKTSRKFNAKLLIDYIWLINLIFWFFNHSKFIFKIQSNFTWNFIFSCYFGLVQNSIKTCIPIYLERVSIQVCLNLGRKSNGQWKLWSSRCFIFYCWFFSPRLTDIWRTGRTKSTHIKWLVKPVFLLYERLVG